MISKSSFLADLAANNKRRTWNIAIFAVMLLIFYPLFLALVLRSVAYNDGYTGAELVTQINYQFRQYMCFPVWDTVIATLFAAVASIHGFSFLYSKRKIDMYMSLPVSKKRRFAAIYINGLVMYYVPLLVSFILCVIVGKSFGVNDGSAFKVMIMSFGVNCIYYFSIYNVVLIALMLTGNVVVTVLGAGVLLFYENCVRFLFLGYYQKFFDTFSHYSTSDFYKTWVSPIGIIASIANKATDGFSSRNLTTASEVFDNIKMPTLHLLGLAVVFLIIAYFLYMKRPMESCSKAMSFVKTKPVIKRMIIVPFALFMGIFFGIGSDTGKDIPVMALGIAIGTILCHCAVEMIYEFDIRAVFKDKRSIIYCGVAACAIFAVFSMDVFGYDKYVPANDKLDHAAIFISYNNTYAGSSYDEDWNYVDDNDRVFDKMEVKKTEVITDIAKENMTHENSDSDTSTPGQADLNSTNAQASVCYTLKNGKKVYRKFNIDYGKNEELLNKLFADSNYKKEMININSPNIENNIKDMSLGYSNGVTFKDAKLDAEDVINSYKADYNAMTFSDVYGKLPVGYIELKYDISKYSSRVFDYPVYEGYSSTIEKLKAAGIDIESYIVPDDIERVEVSNYNYTDEDTEKGYNNGTEKTYEDKDATEAIREALTPSDLVTYSYACGNMFYDSCDASVYLKSNKSKFDWAPVSCVLEKDKTPDFVKADLHLGESDQSQNATISNNESEPEAFVEEVTQAK